MVPESFVCPGGSPNDQIRYRKHSMTDTEWMHSFSTYSQEPPVQRPPPLISRSNIIKRGLYIYEALYSLMRKWNLTLSNQVVHLPRFLFVRYHFIYVDWTITRTVSYSGSEGVNEYILTQRRRGRALWLFFSGTWTGCWCFSRETKRARVLRCVWIWWPAWTGRRFYGEEVFKTPHGPGHIIPSSSACIAFFRMIHCNSQLHLLRIGRSRVF